MFEVENNETLSAIPPHSYPITFRVIALGSFLGLLYFLAFFFPKYYELNRVLKVAQQNFIWGNYHEALNGYKYILSSLKNSKIAKVHAVQTYFALNKTHKALNILEEIKLKLNDTDLDIVTTHMPKELKPYFMRK